MPSPDLGFHEALRSLFWMLMGGGSVGIYSAVWNAITNDGAQRDMVLAAARFAAETGDLPPKVYDLIKTLHGTANSLSKARNDAIHAPLYSSDTGVGAAAAFGHPRAVNLAGKHLLSEFRWCRDAAVALADFSRQIEMAISDPRRFPLPNRLRLPNRGQKKDRRGPARRRAAKPPRRQRKPSRA